MSIAQIKFQSRQTRPLCMQDLIVSPPPPVAARPKATPVICPRGPVKENKEQQANLPLTHGHVEESTLFLGITKSDFGSNVLSSQPIRHKKGCAWSGSARIDQRLTPRLSLIRAPWLASCWLASSDELLSSALIVSAPVTLVVEPRELVTSELCAALQGRPLSVLGRADLRLAEQVWLQQSGDREHLPTEQQPLDTTCALNDSDSPKVYL